ncbi:MAG: peptidase C39 [Lachnospiraceae bacterium]|nr:peptidase C39 [Lachnospiraceae bacterium]
MKNPLHYQHTEFDCGPTSMINALDFLFQREEIPPEAIRNIMLYCLDCYGKEGRPCESGTSCMAMMFLANWLDGFGKTGRLPITTQYLSGESVYITPDSRIVDALNRGGAVILRLHYEVEHYVLLTGVKDDHVLMFDPYYEEELTEDTPDRELITVDLEHPFSYNRIVPFSCFNRTNHDTYSLGEKDKREAVLLFNSKTALTDEKTIEYFI